MASSKILLIILCFCLISISSSSSFPELFKAGKNAVNLDWNTLKYWLMLSYASYCHADTGLSTWTCYWCNQTGSSNVITVTTIINDVGTNTFGWIGYSSSKGVVDSIIVSFRGTQIGSLKNWITDLSFSTLDPFPNITGAKVHSGFYKAYSSVSGSVLNEIKRLKSKFPNAQIYTTGHSLGAALTTILSVDLMLQNYGPIQSYNFGQPRVGNSEFSDYFDKNIGSSYRVVNQDDIVPHLPPRLLSFHHVKTEVWFPNDDINFQVCDSSGEDPNCSDSLTVAVNIVAHLDYLGFWELDGHSHGCGENDPRYVEVGCFEEKSLN